MRKCLAKLGRGMRWVGRHKMASVAASAGLVAQVFALLITNEVRRVVFTERSINPTPLTIAVTFTAIVLSVIASLVELSRIKQLEDDLTRSEAKAAAAQSAAGHCRDEHDELSATIVANVGNLLNGYLLDLAAQKLKLRPTDRVSLYVHDGDASFFLVARHCPNATWNQPGCRQLLPNVGIICRAWTDVAAFQSHLPDSKLAHEQYVEFQSAMGVETTHLAVMRMPSRLYFGLRFDTEAGGKIRPLAVLVVESTDPDRYTEDALKKVFLPPVVQTTVRLLEELERFIPRPSIAAGIEGALT